MKNLIDVFRMAEIKQETRIKLIKDLGLAINNQYAMNITDDVVSELVNLLESEIKARELMKSNQPPQTPPDNFSNEPEDW